MSPRAESLPQGLPPLHVTAANPEAYPRFYSVAQAPDGLLFVAADEAIHAYDGRRWTTLSLPDQPLIRDLAHDGESRLYVGGYGRFGYVELDPAGKMVYSDLTPNLDELIDGENFADVWRVEITPQGVFFRALYHLFRYQPETGAIQTWHHPGRLGGMLWYENSLLLQFRGSGLRRFDGEDFEPVIGGEALTEHIVAFLPLPDGGLLTVGRDGLWRRFHEGALSPWPAPPTLPPSDSFDAYLVLPDGSFALGGPDGTLHLVDPVKLEHRSFQVDYDFISDLAPAVEGGLLVQTDRATTHLFWPSPWTRVGRESGLLGRVNTLVQWQDEWLAVTNAGVQRIHRGRFEPTGWSAFETWDWLNLEGGRGLLADSFNLLEVDPGGAVSTVFEDLYPRRLIRSRIHPNRIFVGTERGLAVIEQEAGAWTLLYRQPDFTGLVTAIVELGEGDLLLGVDNTGLVRVRLSEDHRDLHSWRVYGEQDGLTYGSIIETDVARAGENEFLVSTRTGIWRWSEDHLTPADLAGLDVGQDDQTLLGFARSPTGRLWAYRGRELWQRGEAGDWHLEDLTALEPRVIASVSFGDEGQVLIGDQAAILRYDPTLETLESRPMSVQLRSVELTDGQGQLSLLPMDGRSIVLPHDIESIRFSFALPSYRQPQLNRFRSRMLGYDDDFSNWGQVQRITYSLFTPGPKRFEVEALDHLDRLSSVPPFEFEVRPPWYSTLWARILWAVLALALLGLMILGFSRSRVARVDSERKRLAMMVEQRTADLAAANRKLENMANVDGLTGVANRRRLDEYLAEAWQRCTERHCDLGIVLVDVDHFKEFNDSRGHQAGDEALRQLADVLTRALRRNEDIVARYGGEEFMVVLPAADLAHAVDVAEALRARVESSAVGVTVSAGVASVRPDSGRRLSDLIRAADQALYRAKQNGRNRVEAADSLVD